MVPVREPVIVPTAEPVIVPVLLVRDPVIVPAVTDDAIEHVKTATDKVNLKAFILFLLVNVLFAGNKLDWSQYL